MKLIGFDLEIAKTMRGGYDHDWRDDMPLGISCVGFYCPQEFKEEVGQIIPNVYFNHVDNIPQAGGMSQDMLSAMVDDMLALYGMGYKFVTWNGLAFDFPVLAEESGRVDDCKLLALDHVDMMYHFFCEKGYMIGLAAASDGMGLSGKTEGMSGYLAPIMWACDRERLEQELGSDHEFLKMDDLAMRMKILEYVVQDAKATWQLSEVCKVKEYLHWVSKSGRDNYLNIGRIGWLTVKDASLLPRPDTSWMTSASKEREDFTDWLE